MIGIQLLKISKTVEVARLGHGVVRRRRSHDQQLLPALLVVRVEDGGAQGNGVAALISLVLRPELEPPSDDRSCL